MLPATEVMRIVQEATWNNPGICIMPRNDMVVRNATVCLVGGGAGLGKLLTVRWEAVPHGEPVKVAVPLALILIGCFVYRRPPGGAA
jgi:hypothetical protein